MRTWLTERFGLTVPVVGAPMAGASGGALAQAVSAAGALGAVGIGSAATVEWVAEQARVAGAGGRPFAMGLMAWVLPQRPELLEAVVEARPDLVSVSYGDYRAAVETLRDNGIASATQVGTLEEALAAQDAGVDVVVARGAEGGGHGRGDVATMPLLQQVLDTVSAPVLAAGGISSGRGVAAALAAGAAGAWVGTAFLACTEAATPPAAVERLLEAEATSTVYGTVFDRALRTGWPEQYGGRSLRNAFFDTWVGREDEVTRADGVPEQLAEALAAGDYDVAVLYAGQSVGTLSSRRPAAEVVADLASAADHLARACALLEADAPA